MALKGKKLSLEHKKKLSVAHKGQIPWNKGKKTGLSPWKGKKRSEETKRKISQSNKGKTRNKGREVSQETREKIRKALLGKKQSEYTKRKKSLALKGRESNRKGILHTQQAKVKMRIAAKTYSGVNHHSEYHIKTFVQAINCQDLWKQANGVTLCRDCHNKKHPNLNLVKNFLWKKVKTDL